MNDRYVIDAPDIEWQNIRGSFCKQGLYSYFEKVVGKSARDNPERYCGWFWDHCSS